MWNRFDQLIYFSKDYLFTFGKLQNYSKKTDFFFFFLTIDMAYSDKVINISQNIRKKAYGPWKSHIQNNWCKNVFV